MVQKFVLLKEATDTEGTGRINELLIGRATLTSLIVRFS